jgi:hypothetical protein
MSGNQPKFITPDAVKWALGILKKLTSDQSALFIQIVLSKFPYVPPRSEGDAPFVGELMRYIGVAKQTGNFDLFNPMRGEWLAENYVGSTLYGRLLNGSHWWTLGNEAILSRTPASGLPAEITPNEETFQRLLLRTRSPYLSAGQRLPRLATAILYFRNVDLHEFHVSDPESLWDAYFQVGLQSSKLLERLFEREGDNAVYWGGLLQDTQPGLDEIRDCFPAGGPKAQIGVFSSDMEKLQLLRRNGENEAQVIHRLLKERM